MSTGKDVTVTLTPREMALITTGLYMLHSECVNDDLHYELSSDLGGTPDSDEPWDLKQRLQEAARSA